MSGRNASRSTSPAVGTFSGYKSGGDPDAAYWMAQVRKGIEFRKQNAFEDRWSTWRKYYRGEFEEGILPVNIFFKMVRTLVPRVYFRNPSISITPSKPGEDHYVLAQILERIDNKLIVQMKVKQAIKGMTQNGFMFGSGIGKLGYGAEFTPTPDFLDATAPVGRKKHDFRVEYNDLVRPNMPWFLGVHTGNFIVPKGATDLHSSRWAAHWVRRHVDDVKDDPRLDHVKTIGMQSGARGLERVSKSEIDEDLVDLVEIRDKKSGKVFVLAPYHSERILYCEDDEMLSEGKFPFFSLIFNQDDQVFWGVPDAQILDPQQRELNEIRTIMMKHRRVSLIKILANRESMSIDDATKLVSEEVEPLLWINEGHSVNEIKVLETGGIPAGLREMDALVERDVQEILGLGANQFGEYAPGSADRSATEASIVNMATQIRMDERRDAVADLLVDLVEQVHSIIFNRWTGEQVIDIVGPGGVQIWVQFRPEELRKSGYNVNIDPDSTLPETKAIREAKAIQVYSLFKTNPLIDPHKLTSYLLRQLHGAEFDDMMISPDQAAMMQQAAQAAGMGTGLTPGSPMSIPQYQQIAPQLRAIQGGKPTSQAA